MIPVFTDRAMKCIGEPMKQQFVVTHKLRFPRWWTFGLQTHVMSWYLWTFSFCKWCSRGKPSIHRYS